MSLLELFVSVDDFYEIFPTLWEGKLVADA